MNATNEQLELLTAKLLDGTISDGEYKQIEELIAARPEVGREVTELVRVEDLLKALRQTQTAVTPGLLEKVEHAVAAMVAAGAASAVATGVAVAGKSLAGYVTGALGVAAVAGATYWAVTTSRPAETTQPQQNSPRAAAQQQSPAPQPAPAPPDNTWKSEAPRVNPPPAASALPKQTAEAPPAAGPATLNVGETDNKTAALISRYLDDLDHAVAANDNLMAADKSAKLGYLYIAAKNYKEARGMFGRSIQAAHTGKLPELEGEAHGGLGLAEKQAGNIALARMHFEKAAELLTAAGASPAKWQTELAKLNALK